MDIREFKLGFESIVGWNKYKIMNEGMTITKIYLLLIYNVFQGILG